MRASLCLLAVVPVAVVLCTAGRAAAVEREHQLGVDLGLSLLSIADKSTIDTGGGGGFHYTYGLTDQFNFMAEANASIVALGQDAGPKIPNTRPATLETAGVGFGYVLDITQYVPYGGVLIGPAMMTGGSLGSALFLPDAQLAVGLDYRVNHDWAFGVAGRQHFFFTKMTEYPSYTNVFLRIEYTWGW